MSNGLAFIASVALAANEELERIAPLLMSKTETKHPAQERSNTFADDASQPVKRKRGRPKKYDRKPNEDENYELQTSNSKKTKKEDRYVDISFLPSSKHIDHSLIIWDDRKRSKPKKYTVDGEESDEERQVPNSQGNPPELHATASVQPEVPQTLHPPVEVEKPKKPRVVKPKPPVIVDPNNPDAPLKRPRGRPRKNPDELSVPRKKPNSPQTTQTPNGSVEQVTQVYAQPPRSALEEAVLPSVLLNGLVQMSQPTLLNSLPTANVTVAVKKLPKPYSQPGEQPRKRGRPRKYPLPAGQPAPRPKSVNQAVLPPDSTPPVPFSLPSPSFPIVQNVSYNATPPIALPPLKFDLPTPQTQVALPPLKQMSIHTLVQSDSEPKPLPILSGIQSLYSEHPTPKPVAQAQIQEAPPQPPSPQALSPVQPESPPPLESTHVSNDQATTTNGACGVPLKKRFVKNYDLTPRMGGHLINSLVPHESAATAH